MGKTGKFGWEPWLLDWYFTFLYHREVRMTSEQKYILGHILGRPVCSGSQNVLEWEIE